MGTCESTMLSQIPLSIGGVSSFMVMHAPLLEGLGYEPYLREGVQQGIAGYTDVLEPQLRAAHPSTLSTKNDEPACLATRTLTQNGSHVADTQCKLGDPSTRVVLNNYYCTPM